MSRKAKLSSKDKVAASKDFLSGRKGALELARELETNRVMIYRWAAMFKKYGEKIFDKKNSTYAKEFKLKVIKEYNSGRGSFDNLGVKHNVP